MQRPASDPETAAVELRFYEELNDYLPSGQRKRTLTRSVAPSTTVADVIATFGVPEAEVDLALVNGRPSALDRTLDDGDRVAVYPVFETLDITPVTPLPGRPLRRLRFALDTGLAHLEPKLRRAGYEAVVPTNEHQLAAILEDGWILLTQGRCDVSTSRCYRLRGKEAADQFRELVRRFQLPLADPTA